MTTKPIAAAQEYVQRDLLVTFVETAHPIELKWKQTNIEDTLPPEKLRFHSPSVTPMFTATS